MTQKKRRRQLRGPYAVLNLADERVYVGSSTDVEWRLHTHRGRLRRGAHHNAKMQADWDRRGEEAFAFVFLERAEDLIEAEQRWIDDLGATGSSGYNTAKTAGPPRGWRHSDEAKARISASQRARPPFTPEHCANISRAKTGFRFSEASKAKMRASALRRWRGER